MASKTKKISGKQSAGSKSDSLSGEVLSYQSTASLLVSGYDSGKELVNWLFPAYVSVITLSIVAFLSASMMTGGNRMSLDRAVLTAVNAATCTGFQQKTGPNFFKPPGQILVLLLTATGSLFSMIAGGMAVARIAKLRFTDRQIISAAFSVELIAVLLGVFHCFGQTQSLIEGISQGISTVGNCGMALGSPYDITAWQNHLFVLPAVFLGGIGITVLLELVELICYGRALSRHAITCLSWSMGLYLIGLLLFTLLQSNSWHNNVLVNSSVASLNTRSAGIHYGFVSSLPRSMGWVMMIYMMIGASSGGTGGGLKVTTLASIFGGIRKLLRGQTTSKPFAIACCWLAIYLAMGVFGVIMLTIVEPSITGEKIAFLSYSALSNVGLSHDVLTDMRRGSFILAALMMAGKMVPILILWWTVECNDLADNELAVG